MKQAKELVKALKDITNTGDDILVGTVISVDKELDSSVIEVDGGLLGFVRLRSTTGPSGKGIVFYPAINSVVLVERLNDEEWFVVMLSELDSAVVTIGNTRLTINASGFLIKKDTDTLKDALTLIIDSVKQVTVLYGNNPDYLKLNAAQTKINNLLQ